MVEKSNTIVKRLNIVFILDHRLMHYRAPLFQRMTACNEITVIHRGPALDGNWKFTQVVREYKEFGPFLIVKNSVLDDIDVVVVMQNLRMIQYWLLPFKFWKNFALVFWGIGVSSSGGLPKKETLVSKFRGFCSAYADGLGFYSSYPLSFYPSRALKKAVVLGNSIESPGSADTSSAMKNSILFIGSLDSRKGLHLLLKVFARYLRKVDESSPVRLLRIVGDGPLLNELKTRVEGLGIEGAVLFEGEVLDPVLKKRFFECAAVTVSPLQAGLSVVESFSFGVPYITHEFPVSGGEFLSIIDGENGFLFDSEDCLLDKLLIIGNDRSEAARLGKNSFNFYQENLHLSLVAKRFNKLLNDAFIRYCG